MREIDRLIQEAMAENKPGDMEKRELELAIKQKLFKGFCIACRENHGDVLESALQKCREVIGTIVDNPSKEQCVEHIVHMAADIFLHQCSLAGMKIVEQHRKAQSN